MTDCIYLDHNATTPVDPAVASAMEPYLRQIFGNPSSVEHEHGHLAAIAVDTAREQIAAAIGARANEIIFTGGCTEANNLAILGAARALPGKKHLITSSIEHPSVLEPMKALSREGWHVTYLPVDELGRVTPAALEDAITDDTALVSVMGANNEVGTLEPIRELGQVCADRGVIFHADLAQLMAYGKIDVESDNIQMASLSAHKAYGPKGVGALYIRSRKPRVRVSPILFGGGQERGLRPGTLNTAAIVGMGEALTIAKRSSRSDGTRLRALCQQFCDHLLDNIPDVFLNGHPTERLPGNLSFSISGVDPLALIRKLRATVSFSASSACSTDKIETSHVLLAMFGNTQRARNAFRIAPGRFTTETEMNRALQAIMSEVRCLRAATGAQPDAAVHAI
jgi:cysteine desulfurase